MQLRYTLLMVFSRFLSQPDGGREGRVDSQVGTFGGVGGSFLFPVPHPVSPSLLAASGRSVLTRQKEAQGEEQEEQQEGTSNKQANNNTPPHTHASMDLSKILSPAVEVEEAHDYNRQGSRHPYMPPPQQRQRSESGRPERYSADEMQCAVAILQDFHPHHHHHHPQRQQKQQSQQQMEQERVVVRRGRELVFEKEQKTEADDEDEDEDDEDEHEEDEHEEKPRSEQTSAWSGGDLMSKLDLLVQADEMIQNTKPTKPPHAPSSPKSTTATSATPTKYLRSGVWTRAEEEYAAALIYYFLKGILSLKEGTTLRKFLAEKLCCNRRRVSMKLATESIANKKIPRKVGASVFVALHPAPSPQERDDVADTLDALRRLCFDPLGSPGIENRHRPQQRLGEELPELLHREPKLERRSPQKKTQREHTQHHNHASVKQESGNARETAKTKSTYASDAMRSPTLGGGNIKRRKPTIIRTGFETLEEESYVSAMFEYFMAGVLDLPDGTKLISYLCEQLECSPKTLSMKLAPRRLGERKFPDNLGSITYIHKDSKKNSFLFDRATVEKQLQELRFACFDYRNTTPMPPLQPKSVGGHENSHSHASKSERKNSNASSSGAPSPSRLFSRSGPWSREEEVYAASLIDCFFKGVLDIAEGTTLRAFLSSRLCCNPMRISKKLASEWIADIKIPKKLGSSTFVRRGSVTAQEHGETEEALRKLQHAYLHSETIKEDIIVAGVKHPRQEAPEDDDDDDDDEGGHSSDASSSDDLASLGEKSPKKIRKVLANYSNSPAAKASSSVVKKTSTSASRRKLGKAVHLKSRSPSPSSSSSTAAYERVAPLAY